MRKNIPFEIASPEPEITGEKAMQAFHFLHEQTKEHDLQNMTLDEIHEKSTRQAIGRIKRYTKKRLFLKIRICRFLHYHFYYILPRYHKFTIS